MRLLGEVTVLLLRRARGYDLLGNEVIHPAGGFSVDRFEIIFVAVLTHNFQHGMVFLLIEGLQVVVIPGAGMVCLGYRFEAKGLVVGDEFAVTFSLAMVIVLHVCRIRRHRA